MIYRFLIGGLIAVVMGVGLMAPAPARAFDPFADWISTAAALRSQGVEPATLHWADIEQQCLGLKTPHDQRSYNACKYEKAMATVLHHADKDACLTQARAAYPPGFGWPQATESIITTNATGTTTMTRIAEPLAYGDLKALRRGTMVACMQNRGWASAYHANLGWRGGP